MSERTLEIITYVCAFVFVTVVIGSACLAIMASAEIKEEWRRRIEMRNKS